MKFLLTVVWSNPELYPSYYRFRSPLERRNFISQVENTDAEARCLVDEEVDGPEGPEEGEEEMCDA